ncbi:hypothetical protein HN51_070511 [Arachis hypogaea]|uniref:NADP-dependent oxidoreductase domain-containing protein n=1 Tax=Arachis hypogaea TaxID=3818 RepID=A0A444Z1M0_ARAHY|nr:methylecgonone reductase isoform X1 [Arachis ipaensis]XP_025650953.1 methylecgonone reductase [Arachis hypogaea]QHO12940.1 Methylecgonone reductase [Arachis hypogaea]RYR08089.1 hypothetical protein Ahy_B05g075642 [Arachis hypogaea]
MEAKKVPEVLLNSGHKMPMIGLGTSVTPLPPHETLIQIFIDAFEAGYTHFDTASLYGTEEPLGIALAKALELGIVNSRHEAFITSKLWCNNAHHDLVLPALKTTLKKLGLDYLDLYLIHMPVRLKPEVDGVLEIRKEDLLSFDMKGTWEAMEECQRLGLARSIGVSNFGIKKLTHLLENATIPPSVNQVEMSPSWQQGKLREFCKQKGIHLAAWSPLGSYTKSWGTNSVMESPIINKIATSKHKSVPQVALKWILEQGAIPIVKSFNKERMRENLKIFEWELSQEESQKFSQIPQRRMFSGEIFVSENGPYKSLEEFWDAES